MSDYKSETEGWRKALERAWIAYCAALRSFQESQRRDQEWFDAIMNEKPAPQRRDQ